MKIRKPHNDGFTMALALVAAVVMGLTVLSLAKLMDFSAKQSTHFNTTEDSYRLAEVGLNAAIYQLSQSPDPQLATNGSPQPWTNPAGTYQNFVSTRSIPFDPVHYVISEGKIRVGIHTYKTRLHAYVRVSNVGDYFAATKGDLSVSPSCDLSKGRIYAPKITFIITGANMTPTRVLGAEYVNSIAVSNPNTGETIDPAIDLHDPSYAGDDTWMYNANYNFGNIIKVNGTSYPPSKLPGQLLFPEVFSSDLDDWKSKAKAKTLQENDHTKVCNFKGDIYPPGYSTFVKPQNQPTNISNNFTGDTYGWHDNNNQHHIYYCGDDMVIGAPNLTTTIHGQILFISTGNIYINGNVIKDPAGPSSLSFSFGPSSSTAHEAVLVAAGGVYINPPPAPVSANTTFYIQALIMAPNSSLIPLQYDSTVLQNDSHINDKLWINYKGSMILSEIASQNPNNLPNVFRDTGSGGTHRMYSYDDDFKKFPPPYLPAIAQIYYILEENAGIAGLFGS